MKSFISAYRSIVVGTICGLLMICAWSMRNAMLTQPAWALGQFCLLALMAGLILGGLSTYQGFGLEQSVKLGSKAAVISTIVASACFALMLRTLPGGFAALRGLLIPLAVVLPAILVGTIGATLGALIFRRAEETELVTQNSPRFFGATYWGVILVSILITALCPLYPTQFSLTDNTGGRVSDQWKPPEGMATAPAAAWKLEMQRRIGYFDPSRPLAISKDERFVAGVNGGDIVVFDLDSEGSQRIPASTFALVDLAFSPQGDRVFFVSGTDPRRIGVVDLQSHQIIPLPQPKNHAVPPGRIVWWRDKEIVFDNEGKSLLSLNLDSLEIDPSFLFPAEVEEIRLSQYKGFTQNERWAMGRTQMMISVELAETEGATVWSPTWNAVFSLNDLKYRMDRCFPEIDVTNSDLIKGASDGSRILRVRNGEATAFYFGLRAVPPLRWIISMPHGPEKMQPLGSAKYASDLGELFLLMYAPMINPLTGETIGPDRSQPKAVLRVVKWEGLEAELCMSEDFHAFAQGDVFADIHKTVRRSNPQLLKFEGPHRWWMIAPPPPADASDLAKLPTDEDLQKRLSVATDRVVEQEKKARSAKAEEVAEKWMSKPPFALIEPEVMPNQHEFDSNHEFLRASNQLIPMEQEVTNFVVLHHAKATRGEIAEMVQDYAQQVDHFNHGVVDRKFISTDEFKYHQKMAMLTEEVDGPVKVRDLGDGVVEARYVMSNSWRGQDGKSGSSRNELTLELTKQRGVWQITKHRSVPIK